MKVIVIAAANSSKEDKKRADMICTGTNDDVVINNAIASLPSVGGKLFFAKGDYDQKILSGIFSTIITASTCDDPSDVG